MTLKLRFALTNNIGRQKLLVHVKEVYAHVVHVCVCTRMNAFFRVQVEATGGHVLSLFILFT